MEKNTSEKEISEPGVEGLIYHQNVTLSTHMVNCYNTFRRFAEIYKICRKFTRFAKIYKICKNLQQRYFTPSKFSSKKDLHTIYNRIGLPQGPGEERQACLPGALVTVVFSCGATLYPVLSVCLFVILSSESGLDLERFRDSSLSLKDPQT